MCFCFCFFKKKEIGNPFGFFFQTSVKLQEPCTIVNIHYIGKVSVPPVYLTFIFFFHVNTHLVVRNNRHVFF